MGQPVIASSGNPPLTDIFGMVRNKNFPLDLDDIGEGAQGNAQHSCSSFSFLSIQ